MLQDMSKSIQSQLNFWLKEELRSRHGDVVDDMSDYAQLQSYFSTQGYQVIAEANRLEWKLQLHGKVISEFKPSLNFSV